MTKITKQAADSGILYEVLTTPGNIRLKDVEELIQFDSGDGYKFYHVYIPCSTVKDICLPVDANPREPTKGDVVSKMHETIGTKPGSFHHLNNGINVICDSIEYDNERKKLKISFKEGDGICNGGHTYFSIVTFPGSIEDHCRVHIEFIEIPSMLSGSFRKEVVNSIASARNRNRALLPTTQADYLNYYDEFKKWLGDDATFVSWHEGDSAAHQDCIKSDHFIRLLASLDPFWFKHHQIAPNSNQRNNHKFAAGGIGSIHTKWFNGHDDYESNLYHMAPLSKYVFQIRDMISLSLKEDSFTGVSGNFRRTNFYKWISSDQKDSALRTLHFEGDGDKKGFSLPATFEVLMMGSFRSNIWIGIGLEQAKPAYIGAIDDFHDLWELGRDDLIDNLKSLFSSFDDDPAAFCRKDSSFEQQLINLIYGKKIPEFPVFFYDLENQKKFVEENNNPTHFLSISDHKYAELTECSREKAPEGAQGYRKD